MFGKQIIAAVCVLLIAGTAVARSQQSNTYELYSWNEKGHWHYSLLPGKNQQRTYEEITSGAAVRVGTPKIESELKRLPRGAEVYWQSDAPPSIKRPAIKQAKSFKHPSRKRIQRIKSLCDRLGVRLTLT